jgi:hypothetical protein
MIGLMDNSLINLSLGFAESSHFSEGFNFLTPLLANNLALVGLGVERTGVVESSMKFGLTMECGLMGARFFLFSYFC